MKKRTLPEPVPEMELATHEELDAIAERTPTVESEPVAVSEKKETAATRS